MLGPTGLQKRLTGLFFVLPALIFLALFLLYPLLYTLYLSFHSYNFAYDPGPTFNWGHNYIRAFNDPVFVESLLNTLFFAGFSILIGFLGSLIAALLIDEIKVGFMRTVYETAVFIPVVVPVSLACLIFLILLDNSFGYINLVLTKALGLRPFNWLVGGFTTRMVLVLVSNWIMGFQIILLISALKGVDQDLLDAGKIDGVNWIQKVLYIKVPQIWSTLVVVGILTTIRAFKLFVQPNVMTEGGPVNDTSTLYFYMYRTGFAINEMGYSSAIAYLLSLMILLISLINFRAFKMSE